MSKVFVLLLCLISINVKAADQRQGSFIAKSEDYYKSLIESGTFLFSVDYAYERSGQKVALSKGYDMRIDQNFVSCWLPMTDHVLRSSETDGLEPLQFMENTGGVKIQYDNRNKLSVVVFDVFAAPNHLNVEIHVDSRGKGLLTIISSNREYFRFEGKIEQVASHEGTI